MANAESALLAGMAAGQTYLNIHTMGNPGGEIRGVLAPQVPEPATIALTTLGLAALAIVRRRRRTGCGAILSLRAGYIQRRLTPDTADKHFVVYPRSSPRFIDRRLEILCFLPLRAGPLARQYHPNNIFCYNSLSLRLCSVGCRSAISNGTACTTTGKMAHKTSNR